MKYDTVIHALSNLSAFVGLVPVPQIVPLHQVREQEQIDLCLTGNLLSIGTERRVATKLLYLAFVLLFRNRKQLTLKAVACLLRPFEIVRIVS